MQRVNNNGQRMHKHIDVVMHEMLGAGGCKQSMYTSMSSSWSSNTSHITAWTHEKKNLKKQQQQQWKEYVEFQKNAGGNFDGGHGEHTLTRIN